MLLRLRPNRHSLLRRSLSSSTSLRHSINTPTHPQNATTTSSLSLSSLSLLTLAASSSLLAAYTYTHPHPHLRRLSDQMTNTASAAAVLCSSLLSVLSSATTHGVRLGFEPRVASFLADIAAANSGRRKAIVGAGGGAVVDWLLETVAGGGGGAQAEAARALAYLVADADVAAAVLGRPHAVTHLLRFIFASQPKRSKKMVVGGGGAQAEAVRALAYLVADAYVAEVVLGRPHTVTHLLSIWRWWSEAARALAYLVADADVAVIGRPHAVTHLLRFIFASQPKRSKKQSRHTSFDISDSLKGRSMLVAALMDIITSNCDRSDKVSLKPLLPGNADMRDIAAAIQVIEQGGMNLDEENENDDDDDDGDTGIKGIGMKVLGGTQVVGLARASNEFIETANYSGGSILLNKLLDFSQEKENVASAVVPGLWDDLLGQHVAVPFAAWALANWAISSDVNRAHIQELDQDGHAIWTALTTAERSVKWHGSLVAKLLLEDTNLPLNDSVPDWSFSLLSTVSQASKSQDISLAQVALSAFLVSIKRSPAAQQVVMEKGLHLMRGTAKYTIKHKPVQEDLAKALESLLTADVHISLEESRKWSGVLISWIFGDYSSNVIRSSATKILSRIFEDYGPSSLPVSQGWLALLLNDILCSSKAKSAKGSTPPKINKVKTQIDQANIVSAQQIVNQLANAVVTLAGKQLGEATNGDTSPLEELLNLEPFAVPLKNLKKDSMQKFDAADSAYATLKGIKALTELCVEDDFCQNKIADYGILCLLRRFLLRDDYEQLAAIEAYDASRANEPQDVPLANKTANESSSVRVPPTAHIRRHAAKLLTVLSRLPKIQKAILEDEVLCKWLENCACGKISGCDDVKIQSYARATLLNAFCNDKNEDKDTSDNRKRKHKCPHYSEMIFLINPDKSHWKCPEDDSDTVDRTPINGSETDDVSSHSSERNSSSAAVPLDVVFVHGLRGGPFKTWRVSEDKSSTKSGLVEKIDEEAGKQGTFWPGEWLSADFPHVRLFTLKYKTNLTQWSGATLPLQEVSSMLLEKLVDAGIGTRPVVFVTHSMGGLVVKQMLFQAKAENKDDLVNNAIGLVFYSCPHFGSRLADMPWRMGLVLRPAPTIGELRSGSPRLVELNDYIRNLHRKGILQVLSFCETKVTPIVEGYGGWAFRMEIVPIESAYPGFGELVVLESTDHVNSCKPVSPKDPSYKEILEFLKKLKAQL